MKFLVLGPDRGWHANQLRAAADNAGDSIAFTDYEALSSVVGNGDPLRCDSPAGDLHAFDVILTRTMPLGTLEQVTFRLSILHALQESGVRVANPSRALEIAIDKYATTARLQRLGLPVPRTAVSQTRSDAMAAFEQFDGPVVVKPLFGGEGRGVMRIETRELAWTTFTTLQQLGAVIYQQEYIPCNGQDLRLFVAGDLVWAVQRCNPDDWRTNVSRGATCEQVAVTEAFRELATIVCRSLQLHVAAIDLIQDAAGRTYVLEVNGVPGWKGAQSVIQENLADRIIESFRAPIPVVGS
ncbi:Ribosomal protein S6 modification protein [Rosistilla carotiformis]|uniref:Ribosomal protein S6 modification protein n=1 Tax=Rosistilla carotiformis TaxID=2528017 RepID=A0A518JW53_9BACT|nr:RimK family alpha-L-glutamate ligase [Rosistilla carotiformis]QDV69772.1 Ribosomal protein S6 modification protein [Rosistilla carotiformis]